MIHFNAFSGRSPKALALLTGGVIAASALCAPAQAKDNSDAYKAGAVVLGAASAYMILKGKTVPGIAAAAGAYYAYKTGRKDEREDGNRYPDYSQYPQYPGYNNGSYNGNYPNNYPNNYPGNYPTYNAPANYPNYGGNNGSYNAGGRDNCRDNRNGGNGNYGNYGGGYNGSSGNYGNYGGGTDRYPDSFRAVAPQSAAPAPRTNGYSSNYAGAPIVLR